MRRSSANSMTAMRARSGTLPTSWALRARASAPAAWRCSTNRREVPPAAAGLGRTGSLLVATENLDGEGRTFHRSVILVCESGQDGPVRGVDLTRAAGAGDAVLTAARDLPAAAAAVDVLRGGPVCGGRLGVVQYAVLATIALAVRRGGLARAVLEPSGPSSASSPGVYVPDPWVTLEAREAVQLLRTVFDRATAGSASEEPPPPTHLRLFCGHAAWGRGQLEAEIGRGNWATCEATAADVLETPKEELWDCLWASGRLSRTTAG